MRRLYSAATPCNAGCKYCFSKWNGVYSVQSPFSIERICDREAIIYPCCDGEFFEQYNIVEMTKSIMRKMDKVYLSISTKNSITDRQLRTIIELNDMLQSEGKGFVKFSVSVSNKSKLSEIEPRTTRYEERMDIVRRLVFEGIPSSLTLKPILPFVADEEYFEILEDFCVIVNRVLVGGLYVCTNTPFYEEYVKDRYPIEKREVNWLEEKPAWDYVSDQAKIDRIKQKATELGMTPYDSDADLVASLT